jgi:cytochrome c peroxidase
MRQIKLLITYTFIISYLSISTASLHAEEPIAPIPKNNSSSLNKKLIHLGKILFHDKRLSRDNSVSCASCHGLDNFGIDGTQFSTGINGLRGQRNSPSIYNVRFNESYFWDGRAESLMDQVSGPIHNPVEMGTNYPEIISKLNKDKVIVEEFKKAYSSSEITEKRIKETIVEFEKSLVSPDSAFDLYLGGNKSVLTKDQKQGYKLFKSYGCISCHQGRNVGGNMLQVFGVAESLPEDGLGEDLGRFEFTQDESDKHVFRVPSLRNVHETGPYFHDGSINDLKQAIQIMGKYQLGEEISAKDIDYIYEFLKSLTGKPVGSPQK